MGVNLLQVSRWLGHSLVQITANIHGHLFPEIYDLVISRLDRALCASMPGVDKNRALGGHGPTRIRADLDELISRSL